MLRLLLLAALALGAAPAQARPAPPPDAPVNAFVANMPERGVTDTLTLNNLLTGEPAQLAVSGAQYSMVGRDIVFLDEDSNRVQAVSSDGELNEHPFIQPSSAARRIDWVSSNAADMVAWTVTEGTPDALTTATYVASPEGAGARLALRDGPRAGIRAFPVAFSDDGATLYMDYQPDTIADLTPLRQYAAMYALDLASGTASSLPGKSSCYCGGAVASGQFVRLALAEAGFDVRVTDLGRGTTTVIPSLGLAEYTQAGDVLIAPGGAQALYTLLQLVPGAAPGEGLALAVCAGQSRDRHAAHSQSRRSRGADTAPGRVARRWTRRADGRSGHTRHLEIGPGKRGAVAGRGRQLHRLNGYPARLGLK